jgi:hypothetical protein
MYGVTLFGVQRYEHYSKTPARPQPYWPIRTVVSEKHAQNPRRRSCRPRRLVERPLTAFARSPLSGSQRRGFRK